jgi:hypothetical protein
MSSRQEEKQRRKAEREAAEAEAARSAARKGRLRLALGGLVALAAIVVAVLVLTRASDDDGGASGPVASTKLPAQKETNLEKAAAAAECELKTYPSEGNAHTTDAARWKYKTSPPTSGTHDPVAAKEGLYEPGNSPPVGMSVHALEHGFIDLQYKPGTPKATIDKLETLGSEALGFGTEGYHMLVFENTTKMKPAVAATAWTHSLTCPTMDDGVYDAVRAFRTEYTNKGPELFR